jgi:mycothiol system anti-sigma-R factor
MGLRERTWNRQGRECMTCKEAVDRLNEYLDNELDNATAVQIKKHLDICRLCCDQFEFEKTLKDLVHKCCSQARAPILLKEKILDSLNI